MRLIALLFVLVAAPAFAQGPDTLTASRASGPPILRAARVREPIQVDGRLDESEWGLAQPATNFTQLDPEEGRPASEATEVRILVDDEALYVGARLFDRRPSEIHAHLARRDDGSDSDLFEVSLDSFHDHLTAWRFQVNPAGAVRDAAVYADGSEDASWDAVWEAAATVDSAGWTAEMRIPLSQLHYNAADEATWGIQCVRFIHRRQETDYFAFTPKKEQGGVDRFGLLTGLGRLPEQRHLELLPYVVSRGKFARPASGDPFHRGHDYSGQAGLDFKYGAGPDLTLSGTVNPDFGQAEVDPAVVNLSAYETFYPERRPFFVADAGNFAFGSVRSMNNFGFGYTFYTRRIGRPPHIQLDSESYRFVDEPDQSTIAAAAKLTGKTRSGWTVGALDAVTTSESARYMGLDGLSGAARVEPATNFLVTRIARDLHGGDTQVGALFTGVTRNLPDSTLRATVRSGAYQAGVDWKHAWARRNWSCDGFLLGSFVRGSADAITATQRSSAHYYQRPDASYVTLDPGRTAMNGYYGSLAVARNNGEHWLGSVETQFMSPGYEGNDLGFMNRADRYTFTSIVMYNENRPGRIFRHFQVYPFTYNAWNYGGQMITAGYAAGFYGQLANYWGVQSQARYEPSTFNDQLTRGGPVARTAAGGQASLTITSDSRKPYTLQTELWRYANNRGGWDYSYSMSLSFRPTPGVQISAGPAYESARAVAQYVTSVSDPAAAATYGSRYVFATLAQKTLSLETRVNWVFSPRVSLQLYLQPLVASGAYGDYKEFRTPGTFDFDVYGRDRGTISRDGTGTLTVDPDGPGGASPFSFAAPDFNYRSLRGNAVLRWEYRPGSTLFLIWQQSRSDTGPEGDFRLSRDLPAMMRSPVDNILMAKVTTWFGL